MSFNQKSFHVLRLIIFSFLLSAFLFYSIKPVISHAQITLDGSMGPAGPLTGPDYNITSDLGQIRGSNLFHSFGEFNVNTGESATFSGPNSVANILSRVTGGNQSFIDGLLASTIPGANLYFLNPAGVLFGANASLNVQGSFHVSTADYLRFVDGAEFHADLSRGSSLTVATISAFGFLGDNPASIHIDKSTLEVPEGETISLLGGDIKITGKDRDPNNTIPDELKASSGRVNIASVASSGEITLNDPGQVKDFKADSFTQLGEINLVDVDIAVDGDPGGTVDIRGGRFVMKGTSIHAATHGDIDHPGLGIDIDVKGDVIFDVSEATSSSFGKGRAGGVRLVSETIELKGEPFVQASVVASRVFGSGDGGSVDIETNTLKMNDFSGIVTQVFGSGNAGDITLETDNLELDGSKALSFISTSTFDTGNAGMLDINAENILLRGGGNGFTGFATQVTSGAGDTNANSGKLLINTGILEILDGAQINASLLSGSGHSGNVEVNADKIVIDGLNNRGFPAGIFSSVLRGFSTTGNGGDLQIRSSDVQMKNSGQISTFSSSLGDSGNIEILTDNLKVTDGALLISSNFGAGKAGNIDVNASDSIVLSGPAPPGGFSGSIVALGGVFAKGSGGIKVKTGKLEVLDGSQITARSTGPGDGGSIDITANNVLIKGVEPGLNSFDGINAGIFTSALVAQGFADQATGNAGDINLDAGKLEIGDQGTIAAKTASAGDGGSIGLRVNNLTLTGNAVITAASTGAGNSGNITISAVDTFRSESSSVTTEAAKSDGGNIVLNAQNLTQLINSEITTSVNGGLETVGGNIVMNLNRGVLKNSQIRANAFEGKGGNIDITAEVFLADPNSVVSASSEKGINGEVDIRAPVTNISGNRAPLRENYSSAASLLLKACAVRMSGGERSSLVMAGRDGIPFQPGDLLPSPLYDEDMAAADAKVASMNERPPLAYGASYFEDNGLLPLDMMDWDSGCSACP
ncbi:MAG: filamentous hemagglutinin N-terminal domain-containing protein [Candidatus Scalindua sp.]|nr:filamentous hemagglutinin N-terminal domain-containing protein [Candidatus Scalindua sp.]